MIPSVGIDHHDSRSGARGRARRISVCLALLLITSRADLARADTASDPAIEPSAAQDFPKRLAITVVAAESLLATFGQRVSSWFTDDTQVSITATSEVDLEQILATDPGEVRAWVVPLSPERALVTFSCVTPRSPARHLVREVRLRKGFDELGQERLASVIHSAFVALREGSDGFERAQAERALDQAGISAGSRTPPGEFEASNARSPVPAPRALAPENAVERRRPQPPAAAAPVQLLVGVGYGARLRGREGIGHGPSLSLGAQLPSARTSIDLLVSAQFLFRSEFDAEHFSASVQTTALRAHIGLEPALGSRWWAQLLLGAGVDVAQIHSSSVQSSSETTLQTSVRESGTQWRSAAELSLGLLHHGELLDLGVYTQFTVLLEDVHYSADTDRGERRLVTPWPVQPGLFIQGRFRSAR